MHYDAIRRDHGLPVDPFKALIVPRPIGWISSLAADGGINLAPYSFFNGMSEAPSYVVFGSAGRKDSIRNIEETGEFVCNLATWDLREAVNATSATVPRGTDEFELAGLAKAPSRFFKPPRVAASPAAFECVYEQTVKLAAHDNARGGYAIVVGRVVGIYIDDRFIKDGRVDTAAMKPIARLGYSEYAVVDEVFRMRRPD
jgi:flavin reductase (DIM6/NTAB) family NADH-FMN oxidoreductase RutF